MKADVIWIIGVVFFHFATAALAGQMIPAEVVYLDWTLHSIWFACLAILDLIAVTLLLGAAGAKFLTIVMYCSCAWSIVLALEAALNSDFLIQLDRYAQLAFFIAILAALAWGIRKCRESRPPSSLLRS